MMVVDYFIKKEYNIENPEFSEMSGIMEKDQQKRICWNRKEALNNQSPKHSSQRIFTVSAYGCIVVMIKRNRNNFIKVDVIFEQSKELRFVRFKIFLQSSKISAKESCFCGIIDMSPFGTWFMVSEHLHYITNREEIFDFSNKKMPYSCGSWRFANA